MKKLKINNIHAFTIGVIFLSIYNFIPIRMNEQKNLKKKSQNIERPF